MFKMFVKINYLFFFVFVFMFLFSVNTVLAVCNGPNCPSIINQGLCEMAPAGVCVWGVPIANRCNGINCSDYNNSTSACNSHQPPCSWSGPIVEPPPPGTPAGNPCDSANAAGNPDCAVSLPNPLGNINTPNQLINRVIQGILGIVGSIALVMFIYGGLTWMTAAGNQQRVQKGKDILVWATLGLVVIFSAYALVRFLLVNVLAGATSQTTTQTQSSNPNYR